MPVDMHGNEVAVEDFAINRFMKRRIDSDGNGVHTMSDNVTKTCFEDSNSDLLRKIQKVSRKILQASDVYFKQQVMLQIDNIESVVPINCFISVGFPEQYRMSVDETGPVPVHTLVISSNRAVGSVIIWLENGNLTDVEYAWYTDSPPIRFPEPEDVVIDRGIV
jgi:hypothetical protein